MAQYFPPNSNHYILLLAIYAPFVDRPLSPLDQDNQQFINDVMGLAAAHDGAPLLVAGDFNRDVADQQMEALLTGGRWQDILAQQFQGERPPTTIDYCRHHGGRTIDHLLCNQSFLAKVESAGMHDVAFGHHYPILMRCHCTTHHPVLTLRDPVALPPEAHRPLPAEARPDWMWTPEMEPLAHALANQDTEQARRCWMKRWKALLHERVRHHGGRLQQGMQGRWQLQPPRLLTRGRTAQKKDTDDATTAPLRHLRNLLIEREVRYIAGTDLTPEQNHRLTRLIDQCAAHLRPPPRPPDGPVVDDLEGREVQVLDEEYGDDWPTHST